MSRLLFATKGAKACSLTADNACCIASLLEGCQGSLCLLVTAVRAQAGLNYKESLSGQPAIAQRADYTLAQHIMQTEREAVMCQSLHRAAGSHAAGLNFRQPLVVGVVGEAHLEGIAQLWQEGEWQQVLDSVQQGADLWEDPDQSPMLLLRDVTPQCWCRLSCPPVTFAAPLPSQALPAFNMHAPHASKYTKRWL